MTLDKKLKEIRERCEAAAKGPWDVDANWGVIRKDREYAVETDHGSCKSWALYIARAEHAHSFKAGSDADKNMQFIAHARTDVPMLLEMLEATIDWEDVYTLKALEKIAEKYER